MCYFHQQGKTLIIYEMVNMILNFICKNKHMRLLRKLDETKEIEQEFSLQINTMKTKISCGIPSVC